MRRRSGLIGGIAGAVGGGLGGWLATFMGWGSIGVGLTAGGLALTLFLVLRAIGS